MAATNRVIRILITTSTTHVEWNHQIFNFTFHSPRTLISNRLSRRQIENVLKASWPSNSLQAKKYENINNITTQLHPFSYLSINHKIIIPTLINARFIDGDR